MSTAEVLAIQQWLEALAWWRRRNTIPIYRPDEDHVFAINAARLRREMNNRKTQAVTEAVRLAPQCFAFDFDDRCTSFCRVKLIVKGLQLHGAERSMHLPWGAVRAVLTNLGLVPAGAVPRDLGLELAERQGEK